MRRAETLAGLALALLGIGLPFLGMPHWLAVALVVVGVALLAVALTVPIFRRFFVVQRVRKPSPPLSANPRRSLADELEDYGYRLGDFLDARQAERPEESAMHTYSRQVSGTIHPDSPDAHDRATMSLYFREWRTPGVRLLKEEGAQRVGSEKFLPRAEQPRFIPDVDELPEAYRRLAERLRKLDQDRVIEERQRKAGRVKVFVPADEEKKT